jgi:hypothetical protein
MTTRSCPNHSGAFKGKVALAGFKGEATLARCGAVRCGGQFDVHPNQGTQWKSRLLERATEVFAGGAERAQARRRCH